MLRNKLIAFVLFISLCLVVGTMASPASVTRSLSSSTLLAGQEVNVMLDVIVDNENFYIIDEIYPTGWTVLDNGGLSDAEAGHLKAVVLMGAENTTYIYTLKPPESITTGVYDFSGEYSMQTIPVEPMYGDSSIEVIESSSSIVKITEKTEYGISHNWVYLEIEDLIGKDQHINISNVFKLHGLTEQIGYEITILNQSHEVDDYGWVNVSLGKYKTNITNSTTINGTEVFRSYYFDNGGSLLCESYYWNATEVFITCDYILPDKSVLKEEWLVTSSHTAYDYLPIPDLKEKTVIDGKKIERKHEGIPLPKNTKIQLKFKVRHPLFGLDFSIPDDVNKYNISVCSVYGCSLLDPKWWNISYPYRYDIMSNATTADLPISINDTSGINGDSIWALNKTEMFIYSTASGLSGTTAIANETDELPWENGSTRTGNDLSTLWADHLAVWHFDNGTGTTAYDSLGTYDLTFESSGHPTWTSDSLFGANALRFDGSQDYVNESSTLLDTFPADGMIIGWVKFDEEFNSSSGSNLRFVDKMNSWAGKDLMTTYFLAGDGRFKLYWRRNGGLIQLYTTTDKWLKDQWYMIAFTWGATGLRLYINGTKVANNTATWTPAVGTQCGFTIGAASSTATHCPKDGFFGGIIDEVRVMDRALSATELKEMFWNGIDNLTALGGEEDIILPILSINQPWNTTYDNNTINFNVTGNEPLSWVAVEISGYNNSLTNQSGEWNYLNDSLSDGQYETQFWFNDSSGNMNTTNITFTIDTTPPTITISQPWNTTYDNNTINFNVTGDEPLDWVNVEISGYNNTNFTNQSNEWNYLNDSLPDGTYEAKFWFNDTAGNMNTTSVWFTINFPPNQPTGRTPANESVEFVPVTLKLKVTDSSDSYLNVSFYNATGLIEAVADVANNTFVNISWIPSPMLQNYTWYVIITDGLSNTTSATWQFFADDEPKAMNMHTEERNATLITFEWDNKPDDEWISLYVEEEATMIRQVVTTHDNWTALALKYNTLYSFSYQTGDIYGKTGDMYSYFVRTKGWFPEFIPNSGLQYKRLITVNGVSSDLENHVVNISLSDENFDFANVNDTENGTDFRFISFEDTISLPFNLTYINVSGVGGISQQIIPNATSCIGNWVDCNKTYDADWNTFGSPNIYENVTVLFNYTMPAGAKDSTKWTVKDGDGFGWQMSLPSGCFGGTDLELKAEADYNTTAVNWSCKNQTDGSWYVVRSETNYYHVYYTEVVWYYQANANFLVNVSHLDGNYSTKFWIYYGGEMPDNTSVISGYAGVWNNVTIGSEEEYEVPAPEITDLNLTAVNATAVNLTWEITLTCDSRVKYSLNSWFIGENWSEWSNYTDVPIVNISNLATDTLWYFRIYSYDATDYSNYATLDVNITLGTPPDAPTVEILNYTEERENESATLCGNLTDTIGQSVTLYFQYFEDDATYEMFNISSNTISSTNGTVFCFTMPTTYGETFIYRAVAQGNETTGYSDSYENEYMSIQAFFAGNYIEDDADGRYRQWCAGGVGGSPCYEQRGYWEGSQQEEDWMWVETNFTNKGSLRINWWNGTWTFVDMINDTNSAMWYKKMTGLSDYWYTFEIWNSTNLLLNWTKPSPWHYDNQNRIDEWKYVSFNGTPEAINYELLYIDSKLYNSSVYRWCIASGGSLYECMGSEYWGGGRELGLGADRTGVEYDRGQLFRGGIVNGEMFDTGVLNPIRGAHIVDNDVPARSGDEETYGTQEYRYCYAFTISFWNETIIPLNGITNYYVRYWSMDDWWSAYYYRSQTRKFDFVGLFDWTFDLNSQTRDWRTFEKTKVTTENIVKSVNNIVFNSTYGQSLQVYNNSFDPINFTGDEIYEFGLFIDGRWTNQQYGRYQQAFVIFNLPNDTTLQGMDSDSDGLNDYDELYVYYTNPKSNDTDEGGVDDGTEITYGIDPNIFSDDDITPPTITIILPENKTYDTDYIEFNMTADEPLSWAKVELSGTNHSLVNQSGQWQYVNDTLPDGTYEAKFWAADASVLQNVNTTSIIFSIDTTPPTITILSPINITYATLTIDLNWSVDEAVDWVAYSLNGATNVSLVGNITITPQVGSNHLVIYANDTVGYMNSSEVYFTFKVNLSFGNISVDSPVDPVENSTVQVDVFVNVTGTSFDVGSCSLYNPNGSIREWVFAVENIINLTFTELNCSFIMQYYHIAGTYNISVWANNTNGESDSASKAFAYTTLVASFVNDMSIRFNVVALGQENQSAVNNPTVITNTGNADLHLNITGADLTGAVYAKTIGVGNFSVSLDATPTAEMALTAGSQQIVVGGVNASVIAGVLSTEDLYWYVDIPATPPQEDTYNGSWTLGVYEQY